jgi:hypothetical protein
MTSDTLSEVAHQSCANFALTKPATRFARLMITSLQVQVLPPTQRMDRDETVVSM